MTAFEERTDLLCFEARIILCDALCFTQDAVQFGISATPRVCRIVLSLCGQRLRAQAGFRGLASLVVGKQAPLGPLAQRDALVHLAGARYSGRDHQVPTHQRERGRMTDVHRR